MTEDNELIDALRRAVAKQEAEIMARVRDRSWNARRIRAAYRNHEVEL